MRLSELAYSVAGRLRGEDREITGASTLEEAQRGDITFLANPRYKAQALKTSAGAILVSEELDSPISQVIVGNPYLAFAEVLDRLYPPREHPAGIAKEACVAPSARVDRGASIGAHVFIGADAHIGEDCIIYPGCFIGDGVRIGKECVLYPQVVVYDGCLIGSSCIIHAGSVIGSDGFGFTWDGQRHRKIRQKGIVVLGDGVEIGSNCTIDRAALTHTIVGTDVKTDNLVHIGHNVVVGDHTLIVAQSGIAGSARIGNHVTLAGQCGVIGHITIGDYCVAASRAGITADLKPGSIVSGYPAIDHKQWLRVQKVYKELPELLRRVRELERRLDVHGDD